MVGWYPNDELMNSSLISTAAKAELASCLPSITCTRSSQRPRCHQYSLTCAKSGASMLLRSLKITDVSLAQAASMSVLSQHHERTAGKPPQPIQIGLERQVEQSPIGHGTIRIDAASCIAEDLARVTPVGCDATGLIHAELRKRPFLGVAHRRHRAKTRICEDFPHRLASLMGDSLGFGVVHPASSPKPRKKRNRSRGTVPIFAVRWTLCCEIAQPRENADCPPRTRCDDPSRLGGPGVRVSANSFPLSAFRFQLSLALHPEPNLPIAAAFAGELEVDDAGLDDRSEVRFRGSTGSCGNGPSRPTKPSAVSPRLAAIGSSAARRSGRTRRVPTAGPGQRPASRRR